MSLARYVTEEEREYMRQLFIQRGLTVCEIAVTVGRSEMSVYRHLKKAGVYMTGRWGSWGNLAGKRTASKHLTRRELP